jgi:hypothetical protein
MEIIGFCIKILDSEWKLLEFASKFWILNENCRFFLGLFISENRIMTKEKLKLF